MRDAFAEHSGIKAEALAVTGCPNAMTSVAPWSEVLGMREGICPCQPNFSAINPQFTSSAEDESRIFKSLGWDAPDVEGYLKTRRRCFLGTLDAVEAIARNFPDKMVQVRPHHPFRKSSGSIAIVSMNSPTWTGREGDILGQRSSRPNVVHLYQ